MITAFAIWILLLSLLAWAGQLISWMKPRLAESLGLKERESEVDPIFHGDVSAECIIDTFTLWTLPATAVLILLESSMWIPLGLVGGSIFTYFGGRGILQRIQLTSQGIKIGSKANLKSAFVFLSLWGLTGIGTCTLCVMHWTQAGQL